MEDTFFLNLVSEVDFLWLTGLDHASRPLPPPRGVRSQPQAQLAPDLYPLEDTTATGLGGRALIPARGRALPEPLTATSSKAC